MNIFFSLLLIALGVGNTKECLSPKVLIISMYEDEANVWFGIPEFDLFARNITVRGLSTLFPQVHCTQDGAICQLTTGEGESNAASSISALPLSSQFDLSSTYFLISGIAGINPKVATIGSVTFARYAVHVGLQYEIDAREIPANFSTGFFAQGTNAPGLYPRSFGIYGTEVFEVNEPLRQMAFGLARTAELSDTAAAQSMRAQYAVTPVFKAGGEPPTVVLCDTATSDTFWDGALIGDAFANTTEVWTNGTGVYCSTQQEDNATLNALLRAAQHKLVDFSRIIIMRSASDFDRAPAGVSTLDSLLGAHPAYVSSLLNLKLAGVKIVEAVVHDWGKTFRKGVRATNYVGDIFGSLGGKPDFGPGSRYGGKPAPIPMTSSRRR